MDEVKPATLASIITPPKKFKIPKCPGPPLRRRTMRRKYYNDVISKRFKEISDLFDSK